MSRGIRIATSHQGSPGDAADKLLRGPFGLLLVLHHLNPGYAHEVAERWLQLPWATETQRNAAALFLPVD